MEQPSRSRVPRKPFDFPKAFRLLRSSDYRKVYDRGQRRNLNWLVVFLLRTDRPLSRVGLTVPRRLGPAVDRNRIKRKLREAVRMHIAELGPGWDLVLHPRAQALRLPMPEMEKTMSRFFRDCAKQAGSSRAE